MDNPRKYIAETLDNIYENITDNTSLNFEEFSACINRLSLSGTIEQIVTSDDDIIRYKAKTGLKWSDVVSNKNEIERQIILQLIENPKCFFVLFNTQKGKLRISGKEMATWAAFPFTERRVVSFLIVDNDRTLSEQSVNGLFKCFPLRTDHETITDPLKKYNVRIFELSSNSRITLDEIQVYLTAYAHEPDLPMPLIVALANNKQIEKVLNTLTYINARSSSTRLCAGVIWDEADKTYKQYREKTFIINGISTNFLQFIKEFEDKTIFRCGFVTATEGELLEEEYVECTNAYHYPQEIDPKDQANYFAFHHPECKKEFVKVRACDSNNRIAEDILTDKLQYFKKQLILKDGSVYYRKVILNSNSKSSDMQSFAKSMINDYNVITFNMIGVTLYTKTIPNGKKYSARRQNLNRLLFYIYKMNKLNDKPLIVLGRRKVDRGLGFHYAPRSTGDPIKEIEGKDGLCHTDGIEGLIWTDMILGNKIDDIAVAVQKAGRGAGIIRQCPQYPGQFTYWIDEVTAKNIEHHYKKVDAINELDGANTMQQAIERAKEIVPISKDTVDNLKYDITNVYKTHKEVHTFMKSIIKIGLITSYTNTENTIQYRGKTIPLHIYTTSQDFKTKDIYWGIDIKKIACRIMPIIHNKSVAYIGIYSKASTNHNDLEENTIISPSKLTKPESDE